jgi:hypothetical protein
MRSVSILLWCSILTAADVGQLSRLSETRRFFELRRSLQQPGWNDEDTLLYRGVVVSRFGHEAEGIELLQQFLQTAPKAEMARRANEELATALDRLGRYKDASQAWERALALTPPNDHEREGNENSRLLLDSLGEIPPLTADVGEATPVKAVRNGLGSWNVPVRVNGVTGGWIFDTGANVSTLSESEAKRMGLSIRDSKAWVSGSTAKRNALRLTVADVLFGSAHIRNVVFLVLADQALYIPPIHKQITGILGLPALRALGRVEILQDGAVQIRPAQKASNGTPNLFFDGESPIVELTHGQHRVQMLLDTGANATELYPSFRDSLTPQELVKLKAKKEKVGGAGAVIQRRMLVVPQLQVQFFDAAVNLKSLSLLPEPPKGDPRYRDGVIGMDALWGGFLLDFEAMRLDVEQ